MTAGELCVRSVPAAHREMGLVEAVRLMQAHDIGCMEVVDATPDGEVPVGTLTDRDIAANVVLEVEARRLRVEDAMSSAPVSVRETASMGEAFATMRRAGVGRVPVPDGRGGLQGLLLRDDVVLMMGRQPEPVNPARRRGAMTQPPSASG